MSPLAIVIPWFGVDLTGGAEQQAFQLATRLAARGYDVDVLTTCNRSFNSDWSINHYPSGASQEHRLTIRRFPVDARDTVAFDRVNAKLLSLDVNSLRRGVSPLSPSDEHTFVHENIKSAALLDHLRIEGSKYSALIFLPYMFAPVMLGAALVADRAWVQPCLHDEPQAYLRQTATLFRSVGGLLFNSEGEMELALRLYGPGIYSRSAIVGEGIERDHFERKDVALALPAVLQGAPFVLYLGRRDRLKNVDLLARAFMKFKAAQPSSTLLLVLAGPGDESFASDAGIHDLGLISNETKAALLANCRALAQPSRNESFSRTMMEAWAAGRPVAGSEQCLATSIAIKKAQGGWTASSEEEWTNLFAHIESATADVLDSLGQAGRTYADLHADWDTVLVAYESLVELKPKTQQLACSRDLAPHISPPIGLTAIHQLLPDIVFGDAISNQALAIRDHLRLCGYVSDIIVKRRDNRMDSEALLFADTQPQPNEGLLYHHAHPGPKGLIYHNITPGKYFAPYRPGFAWMLEVGRDNLKRLAGHFQVSAGDSAYNAAELEACGFHEPGILPIIIDPDKWNRAPAEQLMAHLQDGLTNLLFVGRIAPNKKQDRLVEAFAHYRELDPNSRLVLVGEGRASDPYFDYLLDSIKGLDLQSHVEVTGQIEDAELLAYYQTAHLYWSLSEHEGFGGPLIEAMWFDVPVLALSASAVPETMGTAGVLYAGDEELSKVAQRAHQLTHDEGARQAAISIQRRRRLDFTPSASWSKLEALVERLTVLQALATCEG